MASECSSGCESGWTSYLEQSLSHKSKGFNHKKKSFCDEYRKGKGIVVGFNDGDDDEDEDLSMVSDASSGPPHFYEDNGNYFNDHQYSVVPKGNTTTTTLNKNGGKRHRNKQQQQHQRQREDHQEDDTASSPLINFSKNNFAQTNNPQGFSATHFQGGPAFQDHFGFLQSSPSGNHLQQQQGHQWF